MELVPVSSSTTPQVRRIHLCDPQTQMSAALDPQQKMYWTVIVNRPPATLSPALLAASPVGDMLPANEFTKQEDLGISEMEGVSVPGVRQAQTSAAAVGGTEKKSWSGMNVGTLENCASTSRSYTTIHGWDQ